MIQIEEKHWNERKLPDRFQYFLRQDEYTIYDDSMPENKVIIRHYDDNVTETDICFEEVTELTHEQLKTMKTLLSKAVEISYYWRAFNKRLSV